MKLKRFATSFLSLCTALLAPMALCGNAPSVQQNMSLNGRTNYDEITSSILNNNNNSPIYLSPYVYNDYVQTPNGTEVLVRVTVNDLYPEDIAALDAEMNAKYPDATLIASSSIRYNCHSYAWYQQSTDNPYWMGDPSAYYTDGSYTESIGYIGDVVCYINEHGENIHSGIVIERRSGISNGVCGDADLITVRSKWHYYGLYEHRGDYCPYVLEEQTPAVTVKYYHRHKFNFEEINASTHTRSCICGESITESHSFTARYVGLNASFHDAYCACGASIKATHTWLPSTTRYRFCQYCHYRKDTWSDIGVLVTDPDRPLLTFLHNY